MKKIFSSIMMAAAALFITSCASDDLTSTQTNGEEVAVSFSLGLEGGIDTRAISDGTSVDRLMYAVFDSEGNRVSTMEKVDKIVTFPATEEVTLVKDKSYKIVFWAQDADCKAYDVNNYMEIKVNYAGVNNDEKRDAFYKSVDVTVSGPTTIDVELKRALAQINVGVTVEDWNAAVKAGATVENSVAYIKQAASYINLVTGQTGNPVDVTYTASAIPAEDLVVDGVAYKWLSMSYILVADGTETGTEKATLNDLGFSFNYDGGAVAFESGLTSVPVQRNCRTNIVGKLLTGDAKFNITVDKMFADDLAYPDNLAQQLELAAAAGGTVTLTNHVTLSQTLDIKADVVINLNGYTIIGTTHKNDGPVIKVNEGASLNISGGTVKSAGENGGSAIQNNGVAIVNGVTLNGAPNANGSWPSYAVNNTGTLTITDSEITSYHGSLSSYNSGVATMNNTDINMSGIPGFTSHGIYTYDGGSVTVNGGNIANNATDQASTGGSVINGAVTVNSGTFTGRIENYSGTPVLKGGSYSVKPKDAYIASGYKAIEKDGRYYVVPTDVNAVVSSNEDFKNAITADVENISVVLTSDVTYEVAAWANDAMGGASTKSIVIEGNGKTITFNQTNSDWNNIVTNGATLTINNAKITNSGHNDGPWNRHDLNFGCDVVLNNIVSDKAMAFKAGATLKNVTINDANTSDTYAIWIQPKGQTVTLDGCTIDMIACSDGRGIKIDNQYVAAAEEGKVTLKVSNTVFKTEEKSAILVKSTKGADITLSNVDITEVAADSTNPVWIDEAASSYASLVNVTGGSVIAEP